MLGQVGYGQGERLSQGRKRTLETGSRPHTHTHPVGFRVRLLQKESGLEVESGF